MDTQLLTLKEVQEKLRIGKTALKNLINEDPDFVTVKMGHRRMMHQDDLTAFLNAKREEDRRGKPA